MLLTLALSYCAVRSVYHYCVLPLIERERSFQAAMNHLNWADPSSSIGYSVAMNGQFHNGDH